MGMTDPIADMLTRVRNANKVRFKSVDVMNSKINLNIAKVLKKSGFITGYDIKTDSEKREAIRIYLKYQDAKRSVLTDIQRISKPGRRVYLKRDKLAPVLNGYGISIVTTSKGVMTDKEARELNLGGELICNVW
jgi:small subunit ribosomal protein S8